MRNPLRASAVAVVAALLASVGALGPAGPAYGGTAAGVPDRLRNPPIWAARVDRSPPGVTAAIYGGDATRNGWNAGRFVAVSARGDRYRTFTDSGYAPVGYGALLSPDGTRVALHELSGDGGALYDMRTGLRTPLTGYPLAFSPDSRLLVTREDGTVRVRSLTGRAVDASVFVTSWEYEQVGLDAAVSRDGRVLALKALGQFWLIRLDGTGELAPYLKVPLGDAEDASNVYLAGSAAWAPDGRTFLVVERGLGRSQLTSRSASTGERIAGTGLNVGYTVGIRVVGRRPGVLLVLAGSHDEPEGDRSWDEIPLGPDTIRLLAVPERPGGEVRTLLTTPKGIDELDVAGDLADVRPAGPPSYGPPSPYLYAVIAAGAGAIVLVASLVLWIRRERNAAKSRCRQRPSR